MGVLLVCFSVLAAAQAATNISGRVIDPSRTPIAGAKVTAVAAGQVSGPSTVSDARGEFSLAAASGGYTLVASADGFEEARQTVTVPQAGSVTRELTLRVAIVHESVTVTETAGYHVAVITSGTKTFTPLLDVPQSVTVVPRELIADQMMTTIGDVVRYVPGITAHQGENNRDQVIIRGNDSSADFFVDGVRDDGQYFRDLYNLERVEALKGPNAMIFGRGGAGGVVNRVTKEAGFAPLHEFTLQGGSFGGKRFSTDLDRPVGDKLAFRLNSVFENSGSFRKYVDLERYGISPVLRYSPWALTKVTLRYEHFADGRTADRGIPSFQGRPAGVPISTFYGDPESSSVRARVNLGSAAVEHQAGGVNIRNRTHLGAYDRRYQNYVPGAVTADLTGVALSAYNNNTGRLNIFNQTDLTYMVSTAGVRHTLLGGVEVGRQGTDNFRNTGYFNNTATSVVAPYADPVIATPATFRQSATDADNHIKVNLGAAYVQDQIDLSRKVQVIAGLRLDYFDLRYRNNRNGDNLRRIDQLLSPRAGIVFKPVAPISIYTSYSVSHLPSSGDQFSSLTTITEQVEPEKFTNYEAGVKWDVVRDLSLTLAAYRLDRTNTRSIHPTDPTRIVQTGSQRTNGFEFGVTGKATRAWQVAGGYAYQNAFVTSATAAARAGAMVAQVPRNAFSLWNNYRILPRLGAGLGILNRSDMFAAIDNTVILPQYTRADGALFFSLTERMRLQVNVENLLGRTYYINANGNNNISPGSPRALRAGLTARF